MIRKKPTYPDGILTWRQGVRCSLATLFAILTVFPVLLGVGYLLDSQILGLAYMAGLLAMGSLPLVIVVLWWSGKGKGHIAGVVVAVGTLLAIHFVATVLSVESLLREPWILDLAPYDGVMWLTLNWSVPLALAGLLIAFAFRKGISRIPAFWIGWALIVCGAVAFIWYGYYFFGELLGESLADNVWWL